MKKVKEIKKALEENANYEYYNELGYIDGYKYKTVAYADILTYINELESENDTLHTNLCEWRKENQQLKDRIAELESENKRLSTKIGKILLSIDTVKEMNAMCNIDEQRKQAVKEFAEKLRKRIADTMYSREGYVDYDDTMEVIDETLKEYEK